MRDPGGQVGLTDYRRAVDALTEGVVIHDGEGRPIACNRAAERLLGLARDQVLEQAPRPDGWQLLDPGGNVLAPADEPARRACMTGQPAREVALCVRRPDGGRTWLAANAIPLSPGDAATRSMVVVSYADVTAYKLAEAALQESEARFRQLAENIDIVFWVGTPSWDQVLYVSSAYERIWGRSRESLYAQPMSWLEPIPADDRQALLDVLRGEDDSDWHSIAFPHFRIDQPDGRQHWVSATMYPIRDEQGRLIRLAGVAEDITERLEQQRRLEDLAHYDVLTRLPNRTLLADRLRLAIAHSRRSGRMLAVCLLDLDGFKAVNDELGHDAGDALLVELAGRMLTAVRGEDTVARLGGDEFVVLLGDLGSVAEAEDILARLLKVVAMPYSIKNRQVGVSASIGVTLYPADDADADTLLRHADHAMYLAKEAGKHRFRMFNAALNIRKREHQHTLDRIHRAVRDRQLRLHYQPVVDHRRGRVVAVEALLRWQHPVLGLLNPSEFLPLIDQQPELAREVGAWVVEHALAQAARWHDEGLTIGIAINLFSRQIGDPEFAPLIRQLLARHPGLPPDRVTLEIGESSLLNDTGCAKALNEGNRLPGVNLALDDFGAGPASLTQLRRMPVRAIKIDHALIRDMLDDPDDLALVEAIISLGGAFRLRVIAAEVETMEQVSVLTELGCPLVQGHAIAHPMPPEAVADWVRRFDSQPAGQGGRGPGPAQDTYQLILAEVRHRQWLNRLLAWIREDPALRGDPPPLDTGRCSFGLWFYGEGRDRYGHHELFRHIEHTHEHIHAAARALVAASGGHDDAALRRWEDELYRLRDEFVAGLTRIRASLGRNGKPS
jgi:diguanylate cyclase (GGDEF)-like protein/PAS domain S-box-containing protein